ncbi:hypothetical protein ABZ697_31145 [Streptomyces albidoflavus]|uniref:hypothetical protein n=1 Tax=Streptomyces albidoflavus TaxID=1886 RepID=UPI0033FB4D7B
MVHSHLAAESRRFMEELAADAAAHRQAAEVARVEAERAAARAVTDSYLTATEFEDWIEEHWVEARSAFVREMTDDGTHGRRSICEWAQEHARGCTAIQV